VAGVGTINATGTGDITDCLIDGNTGDGINWGYSTTTDLLVLNNNTIVGNSGDGVDLLAGSCYLFGNNVIARNGAYGITADAGCIIPGYGNLIPSSGADTNTTGALHNVTLAVPSGLPASLTGSQIAGFVNVGASDYRIGSTSAAKGLGWPGTMPGLTALVSTGVTDSGAVQRAEPTLPAVGDVKSGVQYGDYGTERTGTYAGGAGGGASVIGSSVISPLREVA
jgi:hypothetical protein